MFKYWLKTRFLYDLRISFILSLLFSFAFVYPRHLNYKQIESSNSIYTNNDIDFQIPNPSVQQLNEIDSQSFVEDSFGYYRTKTDAYSTTSSKIDFLRSDRMDHLSFTRFKDTNLLSKKDISSDAALVDQIAANKLNVKAGDAIQVNMAGEKLSFIVSAIYKANPLFKEGTILADFDGKVKEVYQSRVSSKSYSGAFLKVSDYSACQNYLSSYIPLGLLKDRNEFDSEEAYNLYNNTIKNGNYSNEIVDFSEHRKQAKSSLSDSKNKEVLYAILGSLLSGLIYLFLSLCLRKRKEEDQYFQTILKNKKKIAHYRLFTFLSSTAFFLIPELIVFLALSIPLYLYLLSLISVLFGFSSYILNLVLDRKYLVAQKGQK